MQGDFAEPFWRFPVYRSWPVCGLRATLPLRLSRIEILPDRLPFREPIIATKEQLIAAAALQNEARIGSRGFLIGPIEHVLASDIGIALVSAVRAMGLHRFVLRIWHC